MEDMEDMELKQQVGSRIQQLRTRQKARQRVCDDTYRTDTTGLNRYGEDWTLIGQVRCV
jgi:hypothetical protein